MKESTRPDGEDGTAERLLQEKLREAMRAGALPGRLPDDVFGGLAAGAECVVCGISTASGEVELVLLEFAGDAGAGPKRERVHAHPRCFLLFKVAVQAGGGSRPGATKTVELTDDPKKHS